MSDNSRRTDDSRIDRRNVLQAVGAAGATVGISGVTTASSGERLSEAEQKELTAEYRDVETIERLLAAETELLRAVSEAGLIEDASVDALNIETLGDPVSHRDPYVDVVPRETSRGWTPDVRISTELPEGSLTISVMPEADRSLAAFKATNATEYEHLYGTLCDPDCDDCSCSCSPSEFSALCDGKYGYEYTCTCNDGGWL